MTTKAERASRLVVKLGATNEWRRGLIDRLQAEAAPIYLRLSLGGERLNLNSKLARSLLLLVAQHHRLQLANDVEEIERLGAIAASTDIEPELAPADEARQPYYADPDR